jgi:hypothetical protein
MAWVLLLALSENLLACVSAGGPPIPASQLFREFPAVFIARVVEIRPTPVITGTVVVNGVSSPLGTPASEVRLSVVQGLKGTVGTEFTVARAGTCGPAFIVNDSYLVFAMNPQFGSPTSLSARFASRPLPEVTEALKYIDAVRSNQPQAFLYGVVTRHNDGNRGSNWWREQFSVQAEGNGAVFETQTTLNGDYHLSLPPGIYTVRLLRKGQPVSEAQTVRLSSGDETLRSFDSIPAPQ